MIEIDAKGLTCPAPIMLLHQSIHEANDGDVLTLIATDPTAIHAVDNSCAFLNHTFFSFEDKEGVISFEVQKGV